MEKLIFFRAIFMWILFLPVPIINGTLREKWYKEKIGEKAAHQIGCVVLSVIFLLYTYLFFQNILPALADSQIFLLGFLWLTMTFVFECAIGLAAKRTWKEIFSEYNIFRGKIWPLVLMAIFFAPYLVSLFLKQ